MEIHTSHFLELKAVSKYFRNTYLTDFEPNK